MAVTKFVRFAAPYRSKTFNDKDNLIIGKNGVLTGGGVSLSGLSITIDPMTIIQNGLITNISTALSANMPTMSAPFFIAVSISTAVENLAETITPVFVKRPEDVNSQVTLVAEYDGTEWRNLPRLQINERIIEAAQLNMQSGFVGVTSGFDVTSGVSTLVVASGTLIGSDGLEIAKAAQTTINKVTIPALVSTQYDRIDTTVFRKPMDDSSRVGVIKQIVGPSFVSGTQTLVEAATSFGASAVTQIESKRSLVDDKVYTAYLEGATLKMRVFNGDLTVDTTFTVTTLVDYHQFAPNFDGSIDIVYVKNTNLYYIRLDNTGAVIYLEVLLLTSSDVLHDCNIACVGSASNYYLHIAVCREVGGTAREIGYFRIYSDGLTVTPYTTWIDLSSNLQRPSFAADNDDSILYIGFDNVDTGRAYLIAYDAFTATPSTPPVQIGTMIELQTEVWNNVTSTLMPTTGASHVRLIRADNKDLFAFWYQHKGSGVYGVAVYSINFKVLFGKKAYILENTDVTQYSADLDGMNRAYITSPIVGGGSIIKSVFDLNSLGLVGTVDTIVTEPAISETNVHFASRGELLHNYGIAAAGKWLKSTAAVATTLRNVIITSDDVLIAHNRKSDDALYVSDTIVGEEPSVKRLYELFNSFGAAGTVSWNIAGANKLVTSAITIRFLNRSATYTIPATGPGGVTVTSGYAVYADIPDEDTSSSLTMKIVKFGEGFIDRYGKRALPLFWNIGGRLFSNFSPYSFDNGGESVTIGATMSDEMIAWLGSGDTAPDPTAHGYATTNYITQSTSNNTSIGLLDQALKAEAVTRATDDGTLATNIGTVASNLAITNAELAKFFGQLKIAPHATSYKATISGVDKTMLDASVLSQELKNLILSFSGAVIDFSTGAILKEDDSTPLGTNFTPSLLITTSKYFWYGISLVAGVTNADNTKAATVLITPSASANLVAASAPFPDIAGDKRLGAVRIFNNAGTLHVELVRQFNTDNEQPATSAADIYPYHAAVGSAAEILAGKATHLSLQAVHDDAAFPFGAPNNIPHVLVLNGTHIGAFNMTKSMAIFGQGYGSVVSGFVGLSTATASNSTWKNLRFKVNSFGDYFFIGAGVVSTVVTDCWFFGLYYYVDAGTLTSVRISNFTNDKRQTYRCQTVTATGITVINLASNAYIRRLKYTLVGGGGGGGGHLATAGGSGGGGGTSIGELSFPSGGSMYPVNVWVGVGGANGSGAVNGSPGTQTYIYRSDTSAPLGPYAYGGGGGLANGGAGGAGGAGGSGIGDLVISGGVGSTGSSSAGLPPYPGLTPFSSMSGDQLFAAGGYGAGGVGQDNGFPILSLPGKNGLAIIEWIEEYSV